MFVKPKKVSVPLSDRIPGMSGELRVGVALKGMLNSRRNLHWSTPYLKYSIRFHKANGRFVGRSRRSLLGIVYSCFRPEADGRSDHLNNE